MSDSKLSRAMQENLLAVLCFRDESFSQVRNSIEVGLFEGLYYDVARRVYGFLDDFGETPKAHLADLFSEILEGSDKRKADAYTKVLQELSFLNENLNVEYTFSNLEKFVRHQNLKAGILEAARELQSGTEGAEDRAETILNARMKNRLMLFDPGTFLLDTARSLDFLRREEIESFSTGVKELDTLNLGPIRKGLHLFIAPAKAGKTWWMINLGKRSLMRGHKVCHVSLEMNEQLMCQRYFQSLFALPLGKTNYVASEFDFDPQGKLLGIKPVMQKSKFALHDADAEDKLVAKVNKWKGRLQNLVVKEFPTSQLSIAGLKAYLDALEETHKFVPDLLIVDYADLMKISSTEHFRLEVGNIYKELRGLAVERNIAISTASQSNRAGAKSRSVRATDVAEDFSKIATVDCALTYSQTQEERECGLARLYVAAARGNQDKFEVSIIQNYTTGQFVIDSYPHWASGDLDTMFQTMFQSYIMERGKLPI